MEVNKIIQGDVLEVLKTLPENSVDSVVTDPPYELGFMGKAWDNTGVAHRVELWKEMLRVLKPGGHLLSFGGSRTYHRMACAIEDAGFEIRDMIEWVYGSGFPKSLNIYKAVSKIMGEEVKQGTAFKTAGEYGGRNLKDPTPIKDREQFRHKPQTEEGKQWEGFGTALKPAHESVCLAQKPFNAEPLNIDNTYSILCELNAFANAAGNLSRLNPQDINVDSLSIALKNASQKQNTRDDLNEVMDILQSEPQLANTALNTILSWKEKWDEISNLMSMSTTKIKSEMITELRILKSLIGQLTLVNVILVLNKRAGGSNSYVWYVENLLNGVLWKLRGIHMLSVQENAISLVERRNSHPEHEPICMVRKPIEKGLTVAENVLKWGTGGINIDGCRVGTEEIKTQGGDKFQGKGICGKYATCEESIQLGRFPANLIHDGSEEVVGRFPQSKSAPFKSKTTKAHRNVYGGDMDYSGRGYVDSGSAARFFKVCPPDSRLFYSPKASKRERDMGCEEMPLQHYLKENKMGGEGDTMLTGSGNPRDCRKRNNHPTCKPIALMEYLIKLVTPPGGVVLDPFIGSGTTGCAAKKNGFKFIGIELNPEYIVIAEARIKSQFEQKTLVK
jgi:DNA modification methylase